LFTRVRSYIVRKVYRPFFGAHGTTFSFDPDGDYTLRSLINTKFQLGNSWQKMSQEYRI